MALSKGRITAWLDSLSPNTIVGYRNVPCKCPFAQFLRWDGAISPHVGTNTYTRKSGTHRRPNPPWMRRVLSRIDARPLESAGQVTAAEMRVYMRMYSPG